MGAFFARRTRSDRRVRRLAVETLEPRQLLAALAAEGVDRSFTIWENQPYTFLASDFSLYVVWASPPDRDFPAVKISTLPAPGLLTLDGVPVAAGQFVATTDVEAGKLQFAAAKDSFGSPYASFTYQVENADLVIDPTPNTIAFDVLPGAPGPATNPKNRLDTYPADDNVDTPVFLGDALYVLNWINLHDGKNSPPPSGNYSPLVYPDVNNDGVVGYADLALVDEYLRPGNAPPWAFPKDVTTYPNSSYAFQVDDFGYSDPFDYPSNAFTGIIVDDLPTSGLLTNNGAAVTTKQFIPVSDILAGQLQYTPPAGGTPTDNFSFVPLDDGGPVSPYAATNIYFMRINVANHLWYNSQNALDVNGDGQVNAADADLVHAWLKAHGAGPLPTPATAGPPFYDVNDDGYVSPVDELTIREALANRAPTFTAGPDASANDESGPQTVVNWATSISPGSAAESQQKLTFQVVVDNPRLFAATPAISPDGTLTFTPAPNASGTASVTVKLHDDGGTADGGVDISQAATFAIRIAKLRPEHNTAQPLDVDSDGQVAPGDALAIINYINGQSPAADYPAVHAAGLLYYLDVDGDGSVAPADALWVINFMNAHSSVAQSASASAAAAGEEGEASDLIALLADDIAGNPSRRR